MGHITIPITSALGLLAVLIPSSWHWKARNTPTIAIIFWLALANLCSFVNAIIWADNVIDVGPVWCDIAIRLQLAVSCAIPFCLLAQMRRLESVASTRNVGITQTARRRRVALEIILCFVVPVILIALRSFSQGHRYNIFEGIGCVIPAYMSWVLVITYLIPLLLACVGNLIYASLALRFFLLRRLQFSAILASSRSGLTNGRYLRLIAMAVVDSSMLLATTIIVLFGIDGHGSQTAALLPYPNLAYVNYDFSTISQYLEDLDPGYPSVLLLNYAPALHSLSFLVFFGFGEEAVKDYRLLWHWFWAKILRPNSSLQDIDLSAMPKLGTAIEFVAEPGNKHWDAADRISLGGVGPDKGDCGFDAGKAVSITVDRSVV